MYLAEKGLDLLDVLFEREDVCRVVVPSAVLSELKHLSLSSRGAKARRAKLALKLLEEVLKRHPKLFEVLDCEVGKDVDKSLVDLAFKEGYILATADRNLKKNALQAGVEVLFLRRSTGRLS